jgi:hypothetical protein
MNRIPLLERPTMPAREIHTCQCPDCLGENEHANRKQHQQMNLLLSRLDEQQRRWYAALEAEKVGHGGIRLLALITGLDEKTIARGRDEMAQHLRTRPTDHLRQSGGGRPAAEKKISP